MAKRIPLSGSFIKVNEAWLQQRAANKSDLRWQFYAAMLATASFDEYYERVGSIVVQPPTTQYRVTADDEIKYAVKRGWVARAASSEKSGAPNHQRGQTRLILASH